MKPDFSGEYLLDRKASTLSPGAEAVRSALLLIVHREPLVRVEGRFEFADGNSFEYSLEGVSDGREVLSRDEDDRPTVSSLHWEGNALVFVDRTSESDPERTMVWRYELQEEGHRLSASELMRGGGHDQDNTWIFERH